MRAGSLWPLIFAAVFSATLFKAFSVKKPKPDAMQTTHSFQNLKDMHAHEIYKFSIDFAVLISATIFSPFFLQNRCMKILMRFYVFSMDDERGWYEKNNNLCFSYIPSNKQLNT
jgi:hypothetical protein